MQEEEAFWCLVQIVEVILPMDYYTNLLGVLIDYKVFQLMMEDRLPKLCKHLDANNFDFNLLITKWLICLFINHLPLDAELAVWDLLMIKGASVLFRVAITLFQMMQADIIKCTDSCEIYMIMDQFSKSVTREQLLKNLYVGVRSKEIDELRLSCREEMFELLEKQLMSSGPPKFNARLDFA